MPIQITGRCRLRSVTVVRGDDPTELPLAPDGAEGLRSKRTVKDIVINPSASMRSLRVVVLDPRPSDVVELAAPEAHEMIQAFPFQRADE